MAVYFAQAVGGGPIKIGTSRNVPVRIKQLESDYRRPLTLLGSIPGGRLEEKEIHRRFSHLQLGRTEQFRPEPDLLEFIGRPLFVSAVPVVEPMEAANGIVLVVRGSKEWGDWVAKLVEHCGISASVLVENAITLAAKQQGFAKKPPKR